MRSVPLVCLLLALVLLTALPLSTVSAASAEEAKLPTVYVLRVAECGDSWISSDRAQMIVVQTLRSLGFTDIRIIGSVEEWGALLQNPPDNVIVINCHGEVLPIPTAYGDDWTAFIRDLAKVIAEHGWIFVNIVGYGFFYVGNDLTVGRTMQVGDAGLGTFLGVFGASAHAWCDQEGELTPAGRCAAKFFGMHLPGTMMLNRGLASDMQLVFALYKVPEELKSWGERPYYGAAAWKIGRGLLIWGGFGGGEDPQCRIAVLAATIAAILGTPKGFEMYEARIEELNAELRSTRRLVLSLYAILALLIVIIGVLRVLTALRRVQA